MTDIQMAPVNERTGANGTIGKRNGHVGGRLKVPQGHQSTPETCNTTGQVRTDTDSNELAGTKN